MHVVWFKRDLRVRDHAPLALAAAQGPTLCLYVYEPELLESPEHDSAHSVFADECLAELEESLAALGGRLTYRVGRMPDVLEALHRDQPLTALYSHRETGNGLTYARDRRVRDWCEARGVPWVQRNQTGVTRRLRSRDGFASRWKRRMDKPLVPVPRRLTPAAEIAAEGRRSPTELGLPPSKVDAQRGGEAEGLRTLKSFLARRGVNYRADMSSPVTGWEGCSRVSPHLAFGTLSMKQVHQRTARRVAKVARDRGMGREVDPRWSKSLSSFGSRLRWHGHFMQRLEDEPAMEFENLNRAFDGLRENHWDEERFAAWREGRTGYPLVDACMRAVRATGWLNFRMRAMVVSFASYHLWLHWRRPALHLARCFLDFEPGIHFSQMQMQSGTTGINSVRIYSPIKQALDQDPGGTFIRRWVPELAPVPTAYLSEPHRMPPLEQRGAGLRIGEDYPLPIVEHAAAYRRARQRMSAWRRRREVREASAQVLAKHGSRKGSRRRRAG